MKRNILFFFLILLCSYSLVYAQHVRFRRISTDEGLMNSMVNAITQDSAGFMWFACSNGLCRYDGKNFVYFQHNPTDTSTINEGLVRTLFYDTEGYMWAGGLGCGLVNINCRTLQLQKLSRLNADSSIFLPSNSVTSIKPYGNSLYISTLDAGIWEYNKKNKKFSKLFGANQSSFVPYRNIFITPNGVMWIATSTEGVWKYNLKNKELKKFNESNTSGENIVYNKVRNVFVDKEGWVWLSFWEKGNGVLMTGKEHFISNVENHPFFGKLLKTGLVSQFMQDRENNIWLCTAEEGAVRFNKKKQKTKSYTNSLSNLESIGNNTVLCAYSDNTGALWFGTWKGGAQVVNPKLSRFGLYIAEDANSHALHNSTVTCFTQLNSGNILMGTGDGVSEFNPMKNTFSRFDFDSVNNIYHLQNAHIYSIAEDKNENVWVAVFGSGIYVFNKKRELIKRYIDGEKGGLSSQIIQKILTTKSNKIYAASSFNGLNIYDSQADKFHFLTHSEADSLSLSSNEILCLLEAKNENIWIGTKGGGLNLFNPKTISFKRFFSDKKNPKSLLSNHVNTLCYDKLGGLWVGTNVGICRYSETDHSFTNYSHYDELIQSEIYSINEDEKGNLWIITSNGLVCFNPLNGKIKQYNKNNGIQGGESIQNANLVTKDNRICTGGLSGFNIFRPSEISDIPNNANIVFTGFSVLNKPFNTEKDAVFINQLTLNYKDYFFSVNFSHLDFSDPSQNTYAYKLEGFNTEWVYIGTTQSVTFTNLNPGSYILKIKAANSMGEWSIRQALLKITIIPPFWKTWWFYSLCILASILLLYLFVRYREKKLQHEKLKLEHKVEERTKELQYEKLKVEEANKDIKDSITYAKRIQDAILPSAEFMDTHMPEHFVLYNPKDIISGDFYWMDKLGNTLFFAAADCTGHGVPGAMVSVVCSNALNKTVVELGISEPGCILDMVRKIVVQTFEKSDKNVKDGMDISLCKLDISEKNFCTLQWAGANNPLWIIRNANHNEICEIKPDKQPIGKVENPTSFTTHTLELHKGDAIFIFTDGFADQFGGEKGKKFMYKSLKNLLLSFQDKGMNEQKRILKQEFDNWKGSNEQVDDVCVIGVRV
ncbi:MAG: SpoIIE family protein phosphatase [Flavobacteriales bacterium]|nr:SpoIIE family protein phosphatase [Flavobacteriales bacterium]